MVIRYYKFYSSYEYTLSLKTTGITHLYPAHTWKCWSEAPAITGAALNHRRMEVREKEANYYDEETETEVKRDPRGCAWCKGSRSAGRGYHPRAPGNNDI